MFFKIIGIFLFSGMLVNNALATETGWNLRGGGFEKVPYQCVNIDEPSFVNDGVHKPAFIDDTTPGYSIMLYAFDNEKTWIKVEQHDYEELCFYREKFQ